MSAGASVYSNITDPVTIDDLSAENITISGDSNHGNLIAGYGVAPGPGETVFTCNSDSLISGDLQVDGELIINGSPFAGSIEVKNSGSSISTTVSVLNFGSGLVAISTITGEATIKATGIGTTASVSVPGGRNEQVQFNNAGSLDGADNLVYNPLNGHVGINSDAPTHRLSITGQMNFTDAIRIGGNATSQGGDKGSVYIGRRAGASVNTRDERSNVCIGVDAGANITSAQQNVCVGSTSGESLSGQGNVLLGPDVGKELSGDYNTFVGREAGIRVTSADFIVLVGNGAGAENSGSRATAIGSSSGYYNSGTDLVSVGYDAGHTNGGDHNTFLGSWSGTDNNTGEDNTFGGYQSGYENQSGNYNTYLGSLAGHRRTQSENTLIGYRAGAVSIGGSQNTFVGFEAGLSAGGSKNIFIGGESGYDSEGSFNTVIGYRCRF